MNFKKTVISKLALLSLAIIVLSSCRKDKVEPLPIITSEKKGMFILNEGGFNENNASLSYYNFTNSTLTLDTFKTANNRGLGDVGNDLKVYGSKMYIIMNVSGTLEIVDRLTAKSIKQVSFKNGEVNRQPRNIVFNKNKAFISSFDGTVAVLDTATLNIEKYITVGRNPDGMAIANGKLYVANSGGLSFPNYDTTVSVVDLTTLEELKKITVVMNPSSVTVGKYGDIYVKSSGNYDDIDPALNIINSTTDVVSKTIDKFSGSNLTVSGDLAYYTTFAGVYMYNVKTEEVLNTQFITDGTAVTMPYGITVDEDNNEVFITDAVNYSGSKGKVYCFDKAGRKKYEITLGLFPSAIAFVK